MLKINSKKAHIIFDKFSHRPKYLSEVCKKVSGLPAAFWITRYTSLDISRLLRNRSLSFTDISDMFGFSSLSHFSRYVQINLFSVCVINWWFFCSHHRVFHRHFIMTDAMVLQEYLIECEWKRLQSAFSFCGFQLAFPDGYRMPAHRGQLSLHLIVTFLVPLHFFDPLLSVGFGYSIVLTSFMPVPETAVYKDTCAVFPHHDVWLPWKSWMIQTIAVAMTPQITSHHHLGFRVLCPNMAHTAMTLFYGQDIVHCYFDLTCRFIFM